MALSTEEDDALEIGRNSCVVSAGRVQVLEAAWSLTSCRRSSGAASLAASSLALRPAAASPPGAGASRRETLSGSWFVQAGDASRFWPLSVNTDMARFNCGTSLASSSEDWRMMASSSSGSRSRPAPKLPSLPLRTSKPSLNVRVLFSRPRLRLESIGLESPWSSSCCCEMLLVRRYFEITSSHCLKCFASWGNTWFELKTASRSEASRSAAKVRTDCETLSTVPTSVSSSSSFSPPLPSSSPTHATASKRPQSASMRALAGSPRGRRLPPSSSSSNPRPCS
mmetsp:Transcript_12029/g.32987  ORF Transcript_12029/g.32987 Transcript_12029/m.32987 type:complete len:282 (-) Transcript_12029:47-892(-)